MAYDASNLYDIIHRNQAELIIDDNARVFTGLFRLEPDDIVRLQLSNIIYVNGTNYIINKIDNYEVNDRRLTKVELVNLSTESPAFITIPDVPGLATTKAGLTNDAETLYLTTEAGIILIN